MSIGRWGALLGLLISTNAAAGAFDKYYSDQVLPIAVDSATYQSEIYIDAMNMGPVLQNYRVIYYGGADTAAPGPMDCGQKVIGRNAAKFSLRDLCPALPAGSQYGMLSFSTVGLSDNGSPARLRVFARVQNFQGIGFSVEGMPPFSAGFNPQVIGLKNGVDANGIRYQANCFIGLWPEESPQPSSPAPVSATLYLTHLGQARGQVSVATLRSGLTRVLDVFAAANPSLAATYQENVTVRFSVSSQDSAHFFGFCTQQENGNFSADFRMASQESDTASTESQVLTPEGEFTPFFTLVGSEIARFRPLGWTAADSVNCWVSSNDMWIRVAGYYDMEAPPVVSETGRLRLQGGLPGFTLNAVMVGLKPGVASADGYVMCRSGRGFPALIRMQ